MAFSETPPPPDKPTPTAPASGDDGDDYPPKATLAAAAQNRQAEAASRAGENPESVLAGLDTSEVGQDSPEHLAELTAWVEKHLSDCKPHDLAAKGCLAWEQDWQSPIQGEDPEFVRMDLEDYLEQHSALTQAEADTETTETATIRNATTEGEIDDGVPAKISAAAGEQAPILAENEEAQAAQGEAQAEHNAAFDADGRKTGEEVDKTERNADTQAELEALQTEFLTLKAEHGTESALRQILAKATIPEARRHIQAVLGRVALLKSAIPGRAEALTRLIDSAGLDLSAQSVSGSFGNLLSLAEASDDFTDEEVESLRAVVAGSDAAIRTGSDYENAMKATVLDEEGNEVSAHPESDPLSFGVGLDGFTSDDGETQYMRATPNHGQAITIDVTNFSPNEKAIAASYLDAWKMAEDAGQTDFLLNLTQYDIRGQSIIDPLQLIEAAQVVNALYGGRAGYNGEVLRGDDRVGMTRWQAQLATPKGDAARSDRNADMSLSAMHGLKIQDQAGNIDLDVLRAFGDYSRDNWFGAPEYGDVQAYLAKLFPAKFENSPSEGEMA